MKILTTGGESHHTPALGPNDAPDAAFLPILDEEKLATVEVVIQIENRRVVPPRVRGIFSQAGTLVFYHAVIGVNLVTEVSSIRRWVLKQKWNDFSED